MKRYFRPRTLGPKIANGESVFYILLDGDIPEGFITDQVPMRAMKPPVSQGGLTLVVNNR